VAAPLGISLWSWGVPVSSPTTEIFFWQIETPPRARDAKTERRTIGEGEGPGGSHGHRRDEAVAVQEEGQEEEEVLAAGRGAGPTAAGGGGCGFGGLLTAARNPNHIRRRRRHRGGFGDGVQQQRRGVDVRVVGLLHRKLVGDGLLVLLLSLLLVGVHGFVVGRRRGAAGPHVAARRIRQRHHRPDRLRLPRGRRGPLRGRWYTRLHAGHAAAAATTAGAAAPATTGSLAAQWIWWKEGWSEAQAGCGGRYGHGRGRYWQGIHAARDCSCKRAKCMEGSGCGEGWRVWWPQVQR